MGLLKGEPPSGSWGLFPSEILQAKVLKWPFRPLFNNKKTHKSPSAFLHGLPFVQFWSSWCACEWAMCMDLGVHLIGSKALHRGHFRWFACVDLSFNSTHFVLFFYLKSKTLTFINILGQLQVFLPPKIKFWLQKCDKKRKGFCCTLVLGLLNGYKVPVNMSVQFFCVTSDFMHIQKNFKTAHSVAHQINSFLVGCCARKLPFSMIHRAQGYKWVRQDELALNLQQLST